MTGIGGWDAVMRCVLLVGMLVVGRCKAGEHSTPICSLLEVRKLREFGTSADSNSEQELSQERRRWIAMRLNINQGDFVGGTSLLNTSDSSPQTFVRFYSTDIVRAKSDDAVYVDGVFNLRARHTSSPGLPLQNSSVGRHLWEPSNVQIYLHGVLSESTGEFCAKGCAARRVFLGNRRVYNSTIVERDCQILVEFKLPPSKTILTPVVHGSVKSLRTRDDSLHFEETRFAGFYEGEYEYTRTDQVKNVAESAPRNVKSSEVWKGNESSCHDFPWHQLKSLRVIRNHCEYSAGLCNPLGIFSTTSAEEVLNLRIENGQCSSDFRVNGLLIFSGELSPESYEPVSPFAPNLFAAEGVWNQEQGQLVMVACRVIVDGVMQEDTCGIHLTLQFSTTRTINQRYGVVGHVRSLREASDPLYFQPLGFVGGSSGESKIKLTYVYHTLAFVEKMFEGDTIQETGAMFPTLPTFTDLDRVSLIRNSQNCLLVTVAYFKPLTIGERFKDLEHESEWLVPPISEESGQQRRVPVSFEILFNKKDGEFPLLKGWDNVIDAEGLFDTRTGKLFMFGCRRAEESLAISLDGFLKIIKEDCKIAFKIQYPSINPELQEMEHLSGTIESLRGKQDAYYFEPLTLHPLILKEDTVKNESWHLTTNSLWRLATLGLAIYFLGLQISHSLRCPASLPGISLLMLGILISGHSFKVVQTLFTFVLSEKNVKLLHDLNIISGWSEVSKLMVATAYLVLLFMELKLLRLVWRARVKSRSSSKNLPSEGQSRRSESVFGVYCILIFLMVFAAYTLLNVANPPSVRSYVDITVDYFLIPQVVGNIFWGAGDIEALFPAFCFGMAMLRSFPRLFKTLSALSGSENLLDWWVILDTSLKCVIAVGPILLAALVAFQQKFGERCFIQWRQHDSARDSVDKLSPRAWGDLEISGKQDLVLRFRRFPLQAYAIRT